MCPWLVALPFQIETVQGLDFCASWSVVFNLVCSLAFSLLGRIHLLISTSLSTMSFFFKLNETQETLIKTETLEIPNFM